MAKWEAICVLISSEICATLTPSSAGSMSVVTRRVPGWFQALVRLDQRRLKRGNMPSRRSAGSWAPSCRAPPTSTPPAMA